MAMGRPDRDVEERAAEIHDAEELGPVDFGREILKKREGVGVRHGLGV